MVFGNAEGGRIVIDLIKTIKNNKEFLSEIDGKIGDGDHGINMNKGFTLCEQKLADKTYTMSEGLAVLGQTLMEEIGGSIGPLYGILFEEMAAASKCSGAIDAALFETMLSAALEGIQEISGAERGDKTLLDTLIPAKEAYSAGFAAGKDFAFCLLDMKAAAEEGWKSTKDMVAKVGRASRLGERSRFVLDAGATSCYLIVASMADSIRALLNSPNVRINIDKQKTCYNTE